MLSERLERGGNLSRRTLLRRESTLTGGPPNPAGRMTPASSHRFDFSDEVRCLVEGAP
jgi:hypothetical protein